MSLVQLEREILLELAASAAVMLRFRLHLWNSTDAMNGT